MACSRTSSASLASLMPPALPRPPTWTWALIDDRVLPMRSAAATASSTVSTASPFDTGNAEGGEELLALVLEQIHPADASHTHFSRVGPTRRQLGSRQTRAAILGNPTGMPPTEP